MVRLLRAGGAPFFRDDETVPGFLARAAAERPDHVYLRHNGQDLTCAGLMAAVEKATAGLAAQGVGRGDRVAVMLGHHLDHVLTFFAVMRLGAVLVPINVALKGPGLEYQLTHSAPAMVIADAAFAGVLEEPIRLAREAGARALAVWRGDAAQAPQGLTLEALFAGADRLAPEVTHHWSDLRIILYTSGTTGAPKGVQMSDRMAQSMALGSIWLSDVQPGSVMHFWDPIYHVFGAEVLVMALMMPLTLHMVPRFSASRFWTEVKDAGASHVHFVGGVLQLLLKQPPSELDRSHGARIAWGGGCPKDVWAAFEERFGVEIREGYGMTETSSFSVINPGGSKSGKLGSIGNVVDYYRVEVVDQEGNRCKPGELGEIRVAEAAEPGVLTTGYYANPAATADALRDGWLYTGDIAQMDADGFLTFHGRKKDRLRRRGENISAWEVERVINDHPEVAECALIGVTNEFGDEDLKIFVRRVAGSSVDGATLIAWSAERMARFQVPRFLRFVEDFRKTPTERIQKQFLSTAIDDFDYDADAARETLRT